jgi:hypothetical protein
MLAISRFHYDESQATVAKADLAQCLTGLMACNGFVAGQVGRALDDPRLWVLQTQWESVGAYRRALSTYDVKIAVVPLLSRALDEPSAFEIVLGDGATKPNEARPRGTVA